jgi:Ca2+/Na+ antiporter
MSWRNSVGNNLMQADLSVWGMYHHADIKSRFFSLRLRSKKAADAGFGKIFACIVYDPVHKPGFMVLLHSVNTNENHYQFDAVLILLCSVFVIDVLEKQSKKAADAGFGKIFACIVYDPVHKPGFMVV